MKLILARHGNTFGPSDKVVWVGSAQDLPLVESGQQQAIEFGRLLKSSGIQPAIIYAAPLSRTREYAQILVAEGGLHSKVLLDTRLKEIDYGEWGGLSSEEVRLRFGATALEAWELHGTWPSTCGWGESEELVMQRILSFSNELIAQNYSAPALIVSSNGVLRYFLKLYAAAEYQRRLQNGKLKVRTGAACVLDNLGNLCCWDQRPGQPLLGACLSSNPS